ncbi:MAG: rhamnulokinase [Bacteroidaceae bacterium]|nr:rhamnulokinase [Bacteroidaceae bacterium]
MQPTHYLAVDLGATSGRTVLATFDGERIDMREFTRFKNPQIPLGKHIFWDLPHLYNEIITALQKVAAEGINLTSIGIDTWGCDVAFFGADGLLLGLPYCYRDPHTDGAMERFFGEQMPQKEIYSRTGIQFMPFNTLFHLDTIRRENSVALANAEKILFIPDALIFMLTGEAVCEYTVASTSQMLNPNTGDLDSDILQALGLSRSKFGRMVVPGENIGVINQQIQKVTGLGPIPVVAVGSHDTASAVAAVPAADGNYAYLSCGTWSLLGIESQKPIITEESYKENFTNEGGLDSTTRFLKNITGLWIFEQCRKEWEAQSAAAEKASGESAAGCIPSDVNELNALSLTSRCDSLINPDDPRFAHPVSMTAAIRDYLSETRQPIPETPADYVRVIFRSLAKRYLEIINILRRISSVDIQRLHVIGGGSRNEYLMQFTADTLQMPVIAGPMEGTGLGNALVQVRAAGFVDSLTEMRSIIGRSIELKTYLPK